MFRSWFHSLSIILNVKCWNPWGDIKANSLVSRQHLRLWMRFCSFDALQLASREIKCRKQWHMKWGLQDWKRICPNQSDVQRVVHLWSLLPWALWGLMLDELISRCAFPGPDLCKVRSLHSGGRRWLSALVIEEVQMLIQSQYTKYFSFHCSRHH